MISQIYVINGNPIALARPRLGHKKVWDCQTELKAVSAIELRYQHANQQMYYGPLHLNVTFYLPIPSSISKKKKSQLFGSPHIFRPDLSNLIKYIEDVATGIIYRDDSLIAKITSFKLYDNNPRTEFTIEILDSPEIKEIDKSTNNEMPRKDINYDQHKKFITKFANGFI